MRLSPLVGLLVLGLGFGSGAGCSSDSDGEGGTSGDAGVTGGAAGSSAGTGGGSAASGGSTGGGGSSGSGGSTPGPQCTTDTDCTAPQLCVSGRCGEVVVATCQAHVFECGDGLDNDGDGLTDMNDRDCLGPCSNNETNFHNCIPGGGSNACAADCYFDQDSGSGNDQCFWDHRCDPLETAEGQACLYDATGCDTNPGCDLSTQTAGECIQGCDQTVPSLGDTCAGRYDTQPAQCESFCGPLTPNGCDCFGCCDVLGDGDYRFMGSTSNDNRGDCDAATCTLDFAIAKDDQMCKKCTPVAACLNTCETCECCLGKDCNQLPAECQPETGPPGCVPPQCDVGVQPCGVDCTDPCPSTHYCNTGCCIRFPA